MKMHVMNMQESQIKISIRLRKPTNTIYSKLEIYTKGPKGVKIPNSELKPQIPNTNKFHFLRQIKPKKQKPNK
jgi:hypothetical protein